MRMKHSRSNKGKAGDEMQTFGSSATPKFLKRGLCSVQILGIIKDSTHFLIFTLYHKRLSQGKANRSFTSAKHLHKQITLNLTVSLQKSLPLLYFFALSAQFLSDNKLIFCVTAVNYIQTTRTKNYLTKYLSEGNYFVYILNFK